jgi:hypothetical protein
LKETPAGKNPTFQVRSKWVWQSLERSCQANRWSCCGSLVLLLGAEVFEHFIHGHNIGVSLVDVEKV